MNKKEPTIYIICGKARTGKDIVASIIEKNNANSIILSITEPLKEYAKRILNWDGSDSSKPRNFLQNIGINLIKNQIDSKLLIRRIIEDIKVFSHYKDVIIISGIRLQEEIADIKKEFSNVVTIKTERPNYESELTDIQKKHITETDLDNYSPDYVIINKNDLKELEKQVLEILNEV